MSVLPISSDTLLKRTRVGDPISLRARLAATEESDDACASPVVALALPAMARESRIRRLGLGTKPVAGAHEPVMS